MVGRAGLRQVGRFRVSRFSSGRVRLVLEDQEAHDRRCVRVNAARCTPLVSSLGDARWASVRHFRRRVQHLDLVVREPDREHRRVGQGRDTFREV